MPFFILCLFTRSYKEDDRGHDIEAFAKNATDGKVKDIVHYPKGRCAENLTVADLLGVAEPHEYGADRQSYEGANCQQYLQGGVVDNHSQNKAYKTSDLNGHQLPFFVAVFQEENTAEYSAEIEKASCPCSDKRKVCYV